MDRRRDLPVIWEAMALQVLAVMALSAFTAVYANFLFALLICQAGAHRAGDGIVGTTVRRALDYR